MVMRIFVEKKPGFDVAATQLADELRTVLGITGLEKVRLFNRYDVDGIDEDLFERTVPTVFSEPQADTVYHELPDCAPTVQFAVEYLPGQFDQRADSAAECVQLISQGPRPLVRSATVYQLFGELSDDDAQAVRSYVVNPVESRIVSMDPVDTLVTPVPQPDPVPVLDGFRAFGDDDLERMIDNLGLAMDVADLQVCRDYFTQCRRDPTLTEIRVIDTYWSDHCRHTTFNTQFDDVRIDDANVQRAYEVYLQLRKELGRDNRPVTLMDIGTIGAKWLRENGVLTGLDESEEINACTVRITVDVDGEPQDWLLLFKNETHNHPTEIEPFGGAATCIGGCIRDPLSGRSYVYQAMRVTGAADPTVPVSQTLRGKLPQRKLVTTAAHGYSSYGNQIGLATGQVNEIYHPGYVAKRMEIGAVVAATPASSVRREVPAPGDRIILLGGRTGRDGIGGATGSSKSHHVDSLELDGAEVQKGNALVERKLQRLFRRPDACRLIKRCNDFGAGGVSVAVGELADGLRIDLDRVPRKYEGLDGTELAISESQERMAVVVEAADTERFLELAAQENLEATPIAEVTHDPRVVMIWNGETIVNLDRSFLASNGASRHQRVHVAEQHEYEPPFASGTLEERMKAMLADLNVSSNKGLSERFDSTIGAATVLMPFGGTRQLTPSEAMVAKLPVDGETTTASAMAWGFNPFIMEANQYTGAYLAVVESLARLVAAGFEHEHAYLTFQEYFEKLGADPNRWGKPFAAVLGALMAQVELGAGAIGGKDSMSGSFEDLDVPPTLVSFAVAVGDARHAVSPEFKGANHRIIRIAPRYQADGLTPDPQALLEVFSAVESMTTSGDALAVSTPGYGASAQALFFMTVGNRIGVLMDPAIRTADLFAPAYGSFFIEVADDTSLPTVSNLVEIGEVGTTTTAYEFVADGARLNLDQLEQVWQHGISDVYPYRDEDYPAFADRADEPVEQLSWTTQQPTRYTGESIAKPRVFIPVFPGNNCEYDSAAAFERAGAEVDTFIVNTLSADAVAESVQRIAQGVRDSQIVMIPGGFSGGDEPDGSAKFITAFFRAPEVTDAVRSLLQERDGLMLGICNGFQALVKLGLVPFGDIVPMDESCPTLTFNTVGRHQSRLVRTRVASNLSPWLAGCEVGDIHTVAISHGEGRFMAPQPLLDAMVADGRIATQYTDIHGVPSMSLDVNPNGSVLAIEGITSPDGRVFGKMGHSERAGANLYRNIPDGDRNQPIFEAGVRYFTA